MKCWKLRFKIIVVITVFKSICAKKYNSQSICTETLKHKTNWKYKNIIMYEQIYVRHTEVFYKL